MIIREQLRRSVFVLFFVLLGIAGVSCGDNKTGSDAGTDTQYIQDIQDAECIDEDGDGYGENCSQGSDCDDSNPFVWDSCSTCVDNDGDHYWTGCDGYDVTDDNHLGEDCDDNSSSCTTDCSDTDNDNTPDCKDDCEDKDRDGYGIGSECLGEDKCDDDTNNWTTGGCSNCKDGDGDGYYINCDRYSTINGPDCDDTVVLCTTNCNDYDSDEVSDCSEGCIGGCGEHATCENGNCQCIEGYINNDNDWSNGCETVQYLFAKTFGGSGGEVTNSIIETGDGGFAVAGCTNSFGTGVWSLWVLKLNNSGQVQWQKTYSGSESDKAFSIIETGDRGFAVAGYTESFGAGNYDYWVIKLDSSGQIQWQKTFGGSNYEEANSIIETGDGGFAIAGYTNSFGAGNSDIWVLKLDSNGQIQWQKIYGGSGNDESKSIIETGDGGFAVAGYTESFGVGNYDYWVIKLDSSGQIQWQKTFGGSYSDRANSIIETGDGGFAVVGGTTSFGTGSDIWVIKLDSNGQIQWQKIYGGSNYEEAFSIIEIGDGGFAVAGYTESFGAGNSDIWVLRLDSNGQIQWQKSFGGSGDDYRISNIIETSDGGFAIAGVTPSFGAGGDDIWILKLNSSGNISSTCQLGQNTNATVTDTSAIVSNTSVSAVNTSATVTNTSATVTNTSTLESTQCMVP